MPVDAQFYRESRVGLSADRSLAAVRDVYLGTEYWGYLGSAMLLAGLVTLFSVVVGVLLAFLIGRTDLRASPSGTWRSRCRSICRPLPG